MYSVKTKVKLTKIGNSKYVIIPRFVVKDLNLESVKELNFEYDNGIIKIYI